MLQTFPFNNIFFTNIDQLHTEKTDNRYQNNNSKHGIILKQFLGLNHVDTKTLKASQPLRYHCCDKGVGDTDPQTCIKVRQADWNFKMPQDLPRFGPHQTKQGQHILVTMPKTVQNADDDREGCRQDNQDNLGQNPIT